MSGTAISKSRSMLVGITGYVSGRLACVKAIAFDFEEEEVLVLGMDDAKGCLLWRSSHPQDSRAVVIPGLEFMAGLYVGRSWGMMSHQGYCDAIQIEFVEGELQHGFTIQFQAARSRIEFFRVQPIPVLMPYSNHPRRR